MRTQLTPFRSIRRLLRLGLAALMAGALGGGPALAEGHGRGGGGEHGGGWGRGGGGDYEGPPGRGGGWRGGYERDEGYRGPPGRGGGRWGYAPPEAYPYPGAPGYPGRRAPPAYGLRRGGLIPPEYRGAIVPDYGRHRLRPPPPGFAWVRMGGRYMLVSRATGQIFDVIGQ